MILFTFKMKVLAKANAKAFLHLVITVKGLLKLPSLHILLKQRNPSLLRKLVFGTFGESLIVFSRKVNLLYLLSTFSPKI